MNCLLPFNFKVASNWQFIWADCTVFGSPKVSILRLSPNMEFQLKYFFLYIATGAKSSLERTPMNNGGLELPHVCVSISGILHVCFFWGSMYSGNSLFSRTSLLLAITVYQNWGRFSNPEGVLCLGPASLLTRLQCVTESHLPAVET